MVKLFSWGRDVAARRVAFGLASAGLIIVVLILRSRPNDAEAPPAAPAAETSAAVAPAAPSAPIPEVAIPGGGRPAGPQGVIEGEGSFRGEPIANGRALFDRKLLVDAGLPESEAQRLRERYEAFQIERAAQVERARQEGRQQEIAGLVAGLERQFRQELGEDLYDYTLYGAGDTNRIRVQDVPADSAAASAGVEKGDLIRRYAGQPVYAPRELVDRLSSIPAGRRVPLQVERAGQLIELQIAAGPLGAPIEPARGAPGVR